jgi:cystathionine beta-lyase/cystathionine gamma-synthase
MNNIDSNKRVLFPGIQEHAQHLQNSAEWASECAYFALALDDEAEAKDFVTSVQLPVLRAAAVADYYNCIFNH